MTPVSPDDRDPVVEAYKKHVDRTLIRENLKLDGGSARFTQDLDILYGRSRAAA